MIDEKRKKRENEVMEELKATMKKIKSFSTKENRLKQYGKYYENNKEKKVKKRKSIMKIIRENIKIKIENIEKITKIN
jgi:hypothetical protein